MINEGLTSPHVMEEAIGAWHSTFDNRRADTSISLGPSLRQFLRSLVSIGDVYLATVWIPV